MRVRSGTLLAATALVWALGATAGWPQEPVQQSQANQTPAGAAPQAAPTQSTNPAEPLPPLNPATPQAPSAGTENGTASVPAPDTRPLAGAELITPTLPGGGRSYILTSFSVWEGADSNSQLEPGVQNFEAATIPLATVDLSHSGKANQFSLNFSGGGLIYDTVLSRSAAFDQGGFTDSYSSRRWNLLLADRVSYLPQSSIGFAGIGLAGVFNNVQTLGIGSGQTQLNPVFAPGQSVLTNSAGATTNVAIAQAQYELTPTTSLSATGSFGIQHFSEAGLKSGNDTLAVFSVDHQLTNTDSISLSYSLIEYRYNGGLLAINSDILRLGYARRITHRAALVVLAGPELTYLGEAGVPGEVRRLSASVQARLGYELPRGSFYLSYLHYVSPGSGVFLGSQIDTVSVGANRELSRTWTASVSGGYSRNTALSGYSINPAFPRAGAINYEYGSVRVARTLGRSLRAFAVYELEHQVAGSSLVPGASGNLILRSVFGVGLEFHPRPFGL